MKGLSCALAGTGGVGRPPAPAPEATWCAVAHTGAQRDVVFLMRRDPPPTRLFFSRPRPGRCRWAPCRAICHLRLRCKSSAGEAGAELKADPQFSLKFIVKEKPSGFEGAGRTDPASGQRAGRPLRSHHRPLRSLPGDSSRDFLKKKNSRSLLGPSTVHVLREKPSLWFLKNQKVGLGAGAGVTNCFPGCRLARFLRGPRPPCPRSTGQVGLPLCPRGDLCLSSPGHPNLSVRGTAPRAQSAAAGPRGWARGRPPGCSPQAARGARSAEPA